MEFDVIDTRTGKPVNFDDLLKEDWLKNAKGVFYCDFDDYYISSCGQIVLLDDCGNAAYPPGDRLEFVPCWTATKERLPEKNGDYLCTIKTYDYYTEDDNGKFVGHNPHYTVLICNFVDGEFPCTKYYQNYNVVAWMEVPVAYDEGDNE